MPVAWLLQDGVADYLKSLPIPRSFGDIKELSLKDYLHLTFFFGATGAAAYYLGQKVSTPHRQNTTIKLASDKVVDTFKTEGIDGKAVYCRCWKSAKFPYCDGAHNKYNKETGDNLGPLIISKE